MITWLIHGLFQPAVDDAASACVEESDRLKSYKN